MNDELDRIERAVQQLEAEVVVCLREAGRRAAESGERHVLLPDEMLDAFHGRLDALEAGLYSTDASSLRIVSEQHDAVRIRMIYLRDLLAPEIPRPYVEDALQEFAQRAATAPSAPPPSAAGPREGGGRGLLGGLFSRRPARTPETPPPQPASPRPSTPARAADDGQMRLIYLHKLMEEDRLKLIPPAKRPAPLPSDVRLPDYIARFSARDFAETHFAVRRAGEPIARTPEELRTKLAQREKDKPS
ncbi:MAG: hypothetical protein AB7U81_08665 [Thiohalomonadaceae bacterium]